MGAVLDGAVLEIPAEDLARAGRLELAESALHAPGAELGGVEFSPDLARKTAVLASRLIGNHPLPDGKKRVGYLRALEFVVRNGGTWTHPPEDPVGDETVAMIEGVAAAAIDEDEFTAWIAERLEGGRQSCERRIDDGPDRHPGPRIPNPGRTQTCPPSTPSTTLYSLGSPSSAQL